MKPIYDCKSYDWWQARGMLIETNLQALDIKHLAEHENIYRQRCKLAITIYKDWVEQYQQETDIIELLYGSVEGMMLRRQAEDAAKLYWIVRRDFRAALKKYLDDVVTYQPKKRAA